MAAMNREDDRKHLDMVIMRSLGWSVAQVAEKWDMTPLSVQRATTKIKDADMEHSGDEYEPDKYWKRGAMPKSHPRAEIK